MTLLAWVVALGIFFNLGMLFGAGVAYIRTANNSYEIYEIKRSDGSTQWFTRAEDVATVLELDGYIELRRLRVLT